MSRRDVATALAELSSLQVTVGLKAVASALNFIIVLLLLMFAAAAQFLPADDIAVQVEGMMLL